MSTIIEARVVELLWKQWTVLGVAGVASPAKQAIDLEALIAFTRFAALIDPRLVEESMDWCARIGRSFVSVSRLRQILRTMPPPPGRPDLDLPSMLIDESLDTRRLSGKSRQPSLDHPSLLQLRSRFIFGIGARADVVARLTMQGRMEGGRRASEINPSGYTKVAIATVLDQMAQAGVLHKLVRGSTVRYELTKAKEESLRSLLAPLPRRMPPWAERYAMIAAILEGWRKYGSRRTYAVELAKIVDGLRGLATAEGHHLPLAEPARLVPVVDRWATNLLDDQIWETSWKMKGEDLAPRILDTFAERIVQAILDDDYPVGHTELGDFQFRVVDERKGAAELMVEFTAEHHREDFDFPGHVEGTFHFDPAASKKQDLLESLELGEVRVHFDMGDEGS